MPLKSVIFIFAILPLEITVNLPLSSSFVYEKTREMYYVLANGIFKTCTLPVLKKWNLYCSLLELKLKNSSGAGFTFW